MDEICKACDAMHDRHKNYCETCQLAVEPTQKNDIENLKEEAINSMNKFLNYSQSIGGLYDTEGRYSF